MDLIGGRNPVLSTRHSIGAVWPSAIVGSSVVLASAAIALTSCGSGAGQGALTEVTKSPPTTSVLAGPADVVAAAAAARLFASAPVVVLANADRKADVTVAATRARQAHAPLLLMSAAGPAGTENGRRSATTTSAAVFVRNASPGTWPATPPRRRWRGETYA